MKGRDFFRKLRAAVRHHPVGLGASSSSSAVRRLDIKGIGSKEPQMPQGKNPRSDAFQEWEVP